MSTETCPLENIGYEQMERVINIIGGKWKFRILYTLASIGVMRYSEIKKTLSPITHKMLSAQLKELKKDDLIVRKEYPQVPPKAEYRLSAKGYGQLDTTNLP